MFNDIGQRVYSPNIGERIARRADTGGLLFRRWAGAWIDFVALGALILAPSFLIGLRGVIPAAAPIPALFGLGLAVLYFPVCEGVWGRSLGKLVTGTIVVDRTGRLPGIGRTLVRTLLRLIEVNPLFLGGVPAGFCVMATGANQRIGDLIAGTYVVPAGELKRALSEKRMIEDMA